MTELEKRGDVTIYNLYYSTVVPSKEVFSPIAAYLVMPAGKGPFAGIVFAH
jgi:hypothetical protein